MATIFFTVAMGKAFQQQANILDLAVIVLNEVSIWPCTKSYSNALYQINANTPVLLSSVTGYDNGNVAMLYYSVLICVVLGQLHACAGGCI